MSAGAVKLSMYTDMRPPPGEIPDPAHYDRVVELIRKAEELGLHSVWTTEQHAVDDGYLPAQLPALAAFARETERIRLGAGVLLLPLTQFRRVAQEACVVDQFSHGRLTIGVGAGHHPHEFRAYDVSLDDRAELMERGLAFLKPALAGEIPPDGLPINVPPSQNPIPLVVGGVVRAAIERAARLADGHFAYAYVDPEEVLPRQWSERIEPAMARHGRTHEDFTLTVTSIVWPSDDWQREWDEYVYPAFAYQQRRYAEWAGEQSLPEGLLGSADDRERLRQRMLIGPPDEIAERLTAVRAAYPFDELVVWPQLPGIPFELSERTLATLAGEVIPRTDRP